MALSRLDIHHLRNLPHVRVQPGPRFNLFWGSNGAGKSSVLEAVHLLGRGLSFRTSDFRSLLAIGADSCTVSGRSLSSGSAIGVEFNRNGISYHLDGKPAVNRAALSERLPMVFLGPDSHKLLTEGPQQRRRFLDWGVFHVEPRFLTAWKRYQRALRQRNMALRTGQNLTPWDDELVKNALEITEYRDAYLERLSPHVHYYLNELCQLESPSLKLAPGWRQESNLQSVLRSGIEQDKAFGYTRHGPHRADLVLKTAGKLAKEVVSRGQQKLLICALILAQAKVVNEGKNTPCILLVDDLASELDSDHRSKLLSLLAGLNSQVFITATEATLPALNNTSDWVVFHVEQGSVRPQT